MKPVFKFKLNRILKFHTLFKSLHQIFQIGLYLEMYELGISRVNRALSF